MCNRIEKLSEANKIKRNSIRVKENPLRYFKKNLRIYFMELTREESLQSLNIQMEVAPWHTEDFLNCLELIVKSPPEDLVEIMDRNGAGGHELVAGMSEFEIYVQYLIDFVLDLRGLFKSHPCRKWYPEGFQPVWLIS